MHPSIHQSIHPSIYHPFIHPPIYHSATYPSIHSSTHSSSIYPSIHPPSIHHLSIHHPSSNMHPSNICLCLFVCLYDSFNTHSPIHLSIHLSSIIHLTFIDSSSTHLSNIQNSRSIYPSSITLIYIHLPTHQSIFHPSTHLSTIRPLIPFLPHFSEVEHLPGHTPGDKGRRQVEPSLIQSGGHKQMEISHLAAVLGPGNGESDGSRSPYS